jgi:Trk-type K+ transport system membrane component
MIKLASTHLRFCAIAGLVFVLSSTLQAQPQAGSNWDHVKALPPQTNLHITTDHGGRTCRIFAVTDDTLTCAHGSSAGAVLQRAEISHIKLTHYGRSTLISAALGGGVGAAAGAVAGRRTPCANPQSFCLNGIGIGSGGVAAIFGLAGALVAGAAGGATDVTRGSSIYIRP